MANVAVFLNSGGLDSLITAKIMHDQGWELHSLFVNLNLQNNEPTKKTAKEIADKYCVSHDEIQLGNFSFNKIYIRNGKERLGIAALSTIVHVVAGTYASFHDIEYVVSGQKNDSVTEDFHTTLTKLFASEKLLDNGIIYLMPIRDILLAKNAMNKGLELGLTMEEMKQTYSCNTHPKCGKCKKCTERKELGLDE